MLQISINAILAASVWAMVGLGFAIPFRVARFFHFAHGIVFTAGAYFTYIFCVWLRLPLTASVFLGILLSTTLGCVMEIAAYRPLRKRGSSPLVLLLASLGIYVVLQNVISVTFGDDTKSISTAPVKEGLDFFGSRITPVEVVTICASMVLLVLVTLLLKGTAMGRAMRAVSVDPQLAKISGIASERVILATFAIGSAMAGIAGTLVALDVDMAPTMGMEPLMMGIVAVVIGGVDSIAGIALGALLLGVAENIGVLFFGSQWQDAIAFGVLVVFLILRPQGFLGRRVAKASL